MTRPLFRRLMSRLAVFAVVVMLWAQCVVLAHPVSLLTAALSMPEVQAASGAGCHAPAAIQAKMPVCAAHCAQGEHSADTARIPTVPALTGVDLVLLRIDAGAGELQRSLPATSAWPPVSWHRPTPHPASLLLI